MPAQLGLLPARLPAAATSGEKKFLAFHAKHPEVYIALNKLAHQLVAKGETRASIKMLWEVLRWQTTLGARQGYKLPNEHHAHYARLLMANDQALAGLFSTRVQKGK